jgi:predicted aspartyl protease
LSFLVMLAQAETAVASPPPVPVNAPERPFYLEPAAVSEVTVVADEPRFVAPTRRDRIGRIWAPVHINGQGPFRLVLATGASHSALTPRLAQTLGLPMDADNLVMLRGATGSAPVPMVPVRSLEVGELLMEPRKLPLVPDALGGADGLLGMDGLANKRISIDFRHDNITIVRSKGQRATGGYQTVPVSFLRGRLLVADAHIGGVPVKAVIDTGGQATLGTEALRAALAERRRQQSQSASLEEITGATLDVQVGSRIATPSLVLGSLIVRNSAMTFADFEVFKHWKMTKEPAVVIGMDVLGLLDTLIIDYRRKEIQVKLRGS